MFLYISYFGIERVDSPLTQYAKRLYARIWDTKVFRQNLGTGECLDTTKKNVLLPNITTVTALHSASLTHRFYNR